MGGRVIRQKYITRADLGANPERLYVFGDNMMRHGNGGQAAAMRGMPNAVGIPTKWAPHRGDTAYFNDASFLHDDVRTALADAFYKLWHHLESGRDIVIPSDGIGTGLAELPTRAPAFYAHIIGQISRLEGFFGVIHENNS